MRRRRPSAYSMSMIVLIVLLGAIGVRASFALEGRVAAVPMATDGHLAAAR